MCYTVLNNVQVQVKALYSADMQQSQYILDIVFSTLLLPTIAHQQHQQHWQRHS
jgi:TRAP-type mannitol/chloroaromatic compound transport system permease small subunit